MAAIRPLAMVLQTSTACDEPFRRILGGEPRTAGDLQRSVDAIQWSADVSARIFQRIGGRVRHVTRDGRDHLLHDTHRAPSSPSISPSTLTTVRLASSILKWLWANVRAPASSASMAKRSCSRVAGASRRWRSASMARHGLWATPPSASRTSVDAPILRRRHRGSDADQREGVARTVPHLPVA